MGSRPFRLPVPKKIVPVNLYNPHEKKEDQKDNGPPGPGKYTLPSSFKEHSKEDAEG